MPPSSSTPRTVALARAAAEKLARRPVPPSPSAWRGWFDGSATPNPGRIGIGALLLGPGGERVEISRHAGDGTSGDAEYLALIALLEAAIELGARELAVYGDSQVVVQDVLMAGVPGAKGLEEHRARALGLMARLDGVALRWLPRHRNGEADRLSQRAIAGTRQAGDGPAARAPAPEPG
ncbi:reverse transcriptase-like protein [Massilia dura]|uniref:Reverse transcriptase-like protein n=1 Tax=Pseudoduganella dura TaxID=321982 RepID=A0A6I3X2N9_9BURK|nr:ribonuclease HI family protein [Pseudoduganella dura]MUI11124.1 reverse transcriptase-like protein [Pseudoduganella dura]